MQPGGGPSKGARTAYRAWRWCLPSDLCPYAEPQALTLTCLAQPIHEKKHEAHFRKPCPSPARKLSSPGYTPPQIWRKGRETILDHVFEAGGATMSTTRGTLESPGTLPRCPPALPRPSESISTKPSSPLLPPRLLHEFALALVGSPWGLVL